MTTQLTFPQLQTYARTAGFLYLTVVFLGAFSAAYVPFFNIVNGDAPATASNILANEPYVRLSVVASLVNQLVNILLVLTLYQLLKPASTTHATLMLVFLLVSVPITMLNELHQLAPVLLLNGDGYLQSFSTEQLHGLVYFFFNLHKHDLSIAYIFWGLWLFPMGYAVIRAAYLPSFLGVLLMIASFGYVFDAFTAFLLPNFEFDIVFFTFIGEVTLTLWLLFRGVDINKWHEHQLATA